MWYTPKQRLSCVLKLQEHGYNTIEYATALFGCCVRSIWYWLYKYKKYMTLENRFNYTKHHNEHKPYEYNSISNILSKYPTIGYLQLYGILTSEYNYTRSYPTMYSFIKKNFPRALTKTTKEYIPHIYNTPQMFGHKWQMDVKCVPSICRNGIAILDKFYQYTMIDETTRKRFVYCYLEQTGDSTYDFILRAIKFFKYKPIQIQTDNGSEFVNRHTGKNATNKLHRIEQQLQNFCIDFKQIRPATPRHNGKVERSHRNDQMWLYDHLKFNNLKELNIALYKHLQICNNTPNRMLDKTRHTSPNKRHNELLLLLLKFMKDKGYSKISLQNAIYEYSKYSNNEYYRYVKQYKLSPSDNMALILYSP